MYEEMIFETKRNSLYALDRHRVKKLNIDRRKYRELMFDIAPRSVFVYLNSLTKFMGLNSQTLETYTLYERNLYIDHLELLDLLKRNEHKYKANTLVKSNPLINDYLGLVKSDSDLELKVACINSILQSNKNSYNSICQYNKHRIDMLNKQHLLLNVHEKHILGLIEYNYTRAIKNEVNMLPPLVLTLMTENYLNERKSFLE